MTLIGSGQGSVAGSSEHSDVPSGSIEVREIYGPAELLSPSSLNVFGDGIILPLSLFCTLSIVCFLKSLHKS
jgi:hypothetical protein